MTERERLSPGPSGVVWELEGLWIEWECGVRCDSVPRLRVAGRHG